MESRDRMRGRSHRPSNWGPTTGVVPNGTSGTSTPKKDSGQAQPMEQDSDDVSCLWGTMEEGGMMEGNICCTKIKLTSHS